MYKKFDKIAWHCKVIFFKCKRKSFKCVENILSHHVDSGEKSRAEEKHVWNVKMEWTFFLNLEESIKCV